MRRTLALSLALSLSLGLLSGCGPAAPAVQAQESLCPFSQRAVRPWTRP